MVALGYTPKEIAAELRLAEDTVRHYIKSAARQVPGRGGPMHRLTCYMRDNDLLSPPQD